MIITERKSKYKHKVIFEPRWANSEHRPIQEWCEKTFGPGGRKNRWRFGWTDVNSTYYFKNSKDATIFLLRWSNEK